MGEAKANNKRLNIYRYRKMIKRKRVIIIIHNNNLLIHTNEQMEKIEKE